MSDTASLHNYLMLRGALIRHQQLPWQLNQEMQQELAQTARREEHLVARALTSPFACETPVNDADVQTAVEKFLSGMASLGTVETLLAKADLPLESLISSMKAEMQAAAVLESLTAAITPSEQEVFRWYETHPEQFIVPERREVFQILLTINDQYPENRREMVKKRMDEVAQKAHRAADTFGDLALKYSECPSAIEGGRLGILPAGHLYPELDRELFLLEHGAISRVVESPLGLHLLRCGVVEPSRQLAWDEVRESLTRRMTEHKRKRFLREWLAESSNQVA